MEFEFDQAISLICKMFVERITSLHRKKVARISLERGLRRSVKVHDCIIAIK